MTRLLVSVRNLQEARDAIAGGASIIDVKEPSKGSLGAASPQCWRSIVQWATNQVAVSIALGELIEADLGDRIRQLPEVPFAKIGLSGCRPLDDWAQRWLAARHALPQSVSPVAVVYVDWKTAGAPPPEDVLTTGISLGCQTLLCDTDDKRHGGLLDWISVPQLEQLIAAARGNQMQIVLAGSVDSSNLHHVLAFAPDYVAVRGAVCRGDRTATLCPDRVRQMVEAIARFEASHGNGS